MKIQCPCGAKYSFDVTPESAVNPVRFVCPGCGLDSSAAVNELIRQQFGVAAPPAVVPPLPPPAAAPAAPAAGGGLKISRGHAPAATAAAAAEAPAASFCTKHHNEPATEKCAVCHKPICPKCMELFGFFCSPFCKSKAEANSLKVPEYAGLSSAVDARFWRKTGLIIKSGVALIVLLLGFDAVYNFYLAIPRVLFSVPFDQRAEYGRGQNVGPDQFVSLHGGTLARYDLNTKKAVWSHEFITQAQLDAEIASMERETDTGGHLTQEELQRGARQDLESRLTLLVSGSNVWLNDSKTLTHYDWATGDASQSIKIGEDGAEVVPGNDEIMVLRGSDIGAKSISHIDYASGDIHTEIFDATGKLLLAGSLGGASDGGGPAPGRKSDQPTDAAKLAEQAQNLTTPGQIALPALLANDVHQRAIMAEIRESDGTAKKSAAPKDSIPIAEFSLVPSRYGYVQYSVNLVEEHTVTRDAMKAPPAKRVVDGNLTAGQTTEAANEILNDMQRSQGGGSVTEDESRYQVILRLPGSPGAPEWSGSVTGSPAVYSLPTVNVIAAGKSVTVLDKSNKQLWTASLTYPVSASPEGLTHLAGECPVVEHGDTLYVVDQAVVTAFDKAGGDARWRLPAVGTVGLLVDDQGMVYVNTTSASLDKIKYARQIDIGESIDNVLMKVDPKSGKESWRIKTGGFAYYVSGPFIYTVLAHDEPYDPNANDLLSVAQKPSFIRIMRINPKNGRTIWEHDEDRAPLDIRFDDNRIYLVFHKEVEVLKYLTF